jgi:hypoxanthine phosphoribosyltransferase
VHLANERSRSAVSGASGSAKYRSVADSVSAMIATMTAPEPVIGRILLSQDQIRDRLSELAADIDAHYAGRDLVLLGVLKGAMMVVADLARMLNHDRVEIDWITVSSYGDSTTSSGVIRMLKEPDLDLGGRNVLVIDDITDSGLTLSWLVGNLRSRSVASVEVLTLLRKPDLVKVEVPIRYVGFDIAPDFVAGYGMDYAQRYRNLPYIAVLEY